MSRLSIAYITPEFLPVRGGVSVYSINLIREILKSDIDLHVITPTRNSSVSAEKDLKYISEKGNISIHKLTNSYDNFSSHIRFQIAVAKTLPKLHSQFHFDLIHSNFPSSPELLYLLFKDLHIPVIATCHGSVNMLLDTILASLRHSNGLSNSLDSSEKAIMKYNYPLHKAERMYLKRVDHMIAVSGYMIDWLLRFLSKDDISLVYHGINTELFQRNKALEPSEPTLLFVGRFALHKGIHILLKALPLIFKEIPKVKILIAGNGDNTNTIEYVKKTLNGKNHEFVGFVENYTDLPDLYSKATVFVSPSFEDLLGFRLLEAMSCNVPVIATRVGGVPELISNEENGLLVEAGDHKALADKVVSLLQDESLRRRIARASRETIESRFVAKNMASETLKVYERVRS